MENPVFTRARRKQYLVKGQKVQQVDARELHSTLGAARTDEGSGGSHSHQRAIPEAARWTAHDAWLARGR